MADYGEERSVLWPAAAVAAIGSGVAYGMRGSWKDLLHGAISQGSGHLAALDTAVARGARFVEQPAIVPTTILEQMLGSATSTAVEGNLKYDLGLAAYESALKGRASAQEAMGIFQAVQGAPTIAGAYAAAQTGISGAGGDFGLFASRVTEEIFPGGFYSGAERAGVAPIAGLPRAEASSRAAMIGPGNLSPAAQEASAGYKQQLGEIFARREAVSNYNFYRAGEQEIMRAQFAEPGAKAAFLDIPLRTDVSETYTGSMFGQRRQLLRSWEINAAGSINKRNYSQFLLDTLAAKTMKSKGSERLQKIVSDTVSSVSEQLTRYLPDDQFMTTGERLLRSINEDRLVYTGGRFGAKELQAGIEAGLLPYGSAGAVGAGQMLDVDWREKLFGSLGETFPAHRQPLQYIKPWSLSMANELATGGFAGGASFNPAAVGEKFMEASQGHISPQTEMFLVKPGATNYEQMLAPEMGIMSRRGAQLQQWTKFRTKRLKLEEGFNLLSSVQEDIKARGAVVGEPRTFGSPVSLAAGQELGVTPSGRVARVARKRGVTQSLAGYKITSAGEIALQIQEQHHFGMGRTAKFFGLGGAVKHTMTTGKPYELLSALSSSVTGKKIKPVGERIDAVLLADRVSMKKNPYALAAQQIGSMQVFAEQRLAAIGERNLSGRGALEQFLQSPTEFLGLGSFDRAKITTQQDLAAIMQNRIAVGGAKLRMLRSDIAPQVFGLMSEIDVDEMTRVAEQLGEEVLSAPQISKLKKAISVSTGVRTRGTMQLGSILAESGAGNRAPFESTMLHWLARGGAEGIGADVAADIASRIPSLGSEGAALTKSFGSMIGEGRNIGERLFGELIHNEAAAEDLVSIPSGKLLRDKGYWAKLGRSFEEFGGANEIYVPGIQDAPSIGPNIAGAERYPSRFETSLGNLQRVLKNPEATAETIREAATGLRRAAFTNWAATASLRGRAAGSRYLMSQRLPMIDMIDEAEQLAESMTVRVTKKTGLSMFDEMIASATDDTTKTFLQTQREAFGRGERIAGVIGRYPAVGPYSTQYSYVQAIDRLNTPGLRGLKAQHNVLYSTGAMAQLNTEIAGKVASQQVPIGQAVAQKLDFDWDHQVMAFLSDQQTNTRVSSYLSGGARGGYNEYLARHYAIQGLVQQQPTEAGALLRGRQSLLSQAQQQVIAPMTVGEKHIALRQFRQAIALEGGPAQDFLEAAMWHAEETATLMSRHGKGAFTSGLWSGAAASLGRGKTAEGQALIQQALESMAPEAEMRASFPGLGVNIQETWSPSRMSRQISEAFTKHAGEIPAASQITSAAKGGFRGETLEEMQGMFALFKSQASSDAAQRLAAQRALGAPGVAAQAQRLASTVRSRWRAIGTVLKRGKGPMALGAVAAAGIMMMSPPVSGSVAANPNREGPAGGRNLRAEDSIPVGGPGISPPPARIMRSPRTYHQGSSTMVNVSGSSNDFSGENYSSTMRELRKFQSGGARSRLNVSDSRASLDPGMLADRVYRSL